MTLLSQASRHASRSLQGIARAPLRWAQACWRVLHFGALILALAITPSSYRRENRQAMARHLYMDTVPLLPWFTLLSAVISLVLTRIVVVTAISYGLTQYALEMLIRCV